MLCKFIIPSYWSAAGAPPGCVQGASPRVASARAVRHTQLRLWTHLCIRGSSTAPRRSRDKMRPRGTCRICRASIHCVRRPVHPLKLSLATPQKHSKRMALTPVQPELRLPAREFTVPPPRHGIVVVVAPGQILRRHATVCVDLERGGGGACVGRRDEAEQEVGARLQVAVVLRPHVARQPARARVALACRRGRHSDERDGEGDTVGTQ